MSAIEFREKATRINMQARELNASINDITDTTRAAEIDAQVDAMLAEADAWEARAKRLDKLDAAEAALVTADSRRPSEDRSVTSTGADFETRHSDAFFAMVRGKELNAEQRSILAERRDMAVGTPSAGGYLVPTTLAGTIIQALKAYGPMMDPSVCNQFKTETGNPLNFPTLDDTANTGRLITEAAPVNSTGLTYGQISLSAYKYTSDFFKVSSEALQDSAFDAQALISDAITERLGRIVNTHLTTGDGNSKPTGVVYSANAATTSVANAAIGYVDLVNVVHSVDRAYRDNPKSYFMLSDDAEKTLKKLVDNQGRPLWQPAIYSTGAAPIAQSIMGYSYKVNTDMAAVASGNTPVLFGDFSKFYVRVARDLTMKYAGERFIDNDQVAWVAFLRLDAKLMDTRAIKGLKVS